jgi:hypothetical protein
LIPAKLSEVTFLLVLAVSAVLICVFADLGMPEEGVIASLPIFTLKLGTRLFLEVAGG